MLEQATAAATVQSIDGDDKEEVDSGNGGGGHGGSAVVGGESCERWRMEFVRDIWGLGKCKGRQFAVSNVSFCLLV